MPKHRTRESIKSLVRSHIDSDKYDELKEAKAEMEDKVQEMLNLVKVDGESERNEPLTNMIEDFHKQYESLYACYDHLTGESRQKVQGKHGMDTSSSSSSDTDSDHKKGRNNGKLGNDLEKVKDVELMQELQAAELEEADLKRKLVVAIEAKEASDLEYQGFLSKIQAAGMIIEDLFVESGRWNEEVLKFLAENEEWHKRLETGGKVEAELNQKLADVNNEKNNLILEKVAAINPFAEEVKSFNRLWKGESESEELTLEWEFTPEQPSTDEWESDSSQMQNAVLSRGQEATEQENSSLSLKNFQLSDEIMQLQDKIEDFVTQSCQSREKLDEKEKEILAHETYKSEASGHIRGFEMELDSLYTQRKELEEQKGGEFSELLKKSEDKEKDSSSQLEDLTAKIKDDSLLIQKGELEELSHKSNDASAMIKDFTDQVNEKQQILHSVSNEKVELERQLDKKAIDISKSLVKIDALKEELASKSDDQLRTLEEKVGLLVQFNDLELMGDIFHNHKSQLEGHVDTKVDENNQVSKENTRLRSKTSELENLLTEKTDELLVIQEILKATNTLASNHINALSDEVKLFRKERDSLQSEKSQLESQIERRRQESLASLAQAEKKNYNLAKQVAAQARVLIELEDALKRMMDAYKQQKLLFQEGKENLRVTETKILEILEESQNNYEAKDQTVYELEEDIEDLERELEMKGDEVSTLVENVRTLEVKVHQANQKLRITEQLLTENEKSYKSKEEKLQNERTQLEERMAELSGLVAANKEAQLCEKKRQENEISNIVQELKDEKEHGLLLKEKVGDMEKSLQKGEDEKNSLVKSLKGLEEKLGQLEKVVKEKDEMMGELQQKIKNKDDGILELGEEKREAIRQLCIRMEYHRNRYHDLKDMVSKRNSGEKAETTA